MPAEKQELVWQGGWGEKGDEREMWARSQRWEIDRPEGTCQKMAIYGRDGQKCLCSSEYIFFWNLEWN